MIISKTPFRVSFFGGGTDYPAWYQNEGGAVLSTTINKYCYITIRPLPKFFDYNYRLRYFDTEEVQEVSEIKHPSIRETAKFLDISRPFELVHFAEMPAQSGLGSSSTFTVGLLNALHAFKGEMVPKTQLMYEAIDIEQNMIAENVGSQDQAAAAFGGFNLFSFKKDGNILHEPIIMPPQRFKELNKNLILIFTGFSRNASDIAKYQIENIRSRYFELNQMKELTDEAVSILSNKSRKLDDFGKLLDIQWKLKKEMSAHITNSTIDDIYQLAIDNGALGGKLLGAGSGGFMLLYVEPESQDKIKRVFKDFLIFDFSFDSEGSTIIHYCDS